MFSQWIGAENEQRLFETFKAAVENERKAQHVYAEALCLCTDPFLRPVIQRFIDDRKRHERILIESYKALRARELADVTPRSASGESEH